LAKVIGLQKRANLLLNSARVLSHANQGFVGQPKKEDELPFRFLRVRKRVIRRWLGRTFHS
jgi:hypothetical protein